MQIHHILLSTVLICFLPGLAESVEAVNGKKANYQVGDRLTQRSSEPKSSYKTVTWDDLLPKDWDPMSDVKKLDFSKMKDSDPRAMEAFQNLREAWNRAPIEPKMNGARIRIAGFIVPLEVVSHQITEFLLVPFFGGCIHVPPPPDNQIIDVFPKQPLKGMQTMDTVWISGALETVSSDTEMGNAGYRMKAEAVERYSENAN